MDNAPVQGIEGEPRSLVNVLNVEPNGRKPGKTTPRRTKHLCVAIPSSAVTMHPKGTPAPASSVEVQVFEERVDLSNV